MAPSRVLAAVTLVALAGAASGCIFSTPQGIPEGRHEERPPAGRGYTSLDLKAMDMQVAVGNVSRAEAWSVRGGNFTDGVFTIVTDPMTLRYRVDEPLPVGTIFDEDLSRENTFVFDFSWRDAESGVTLTRVGGVDPGSRLNVTTWEPASQDVAGFVFFVFEGWCEAGDDGCTQPGERHTVRVTGKFPKRLH